MVYTLFATFFAIALVGSAAVVMYELHHRVDQIEALFLRYRAMKQALAADIGNSDVTSRPTGPARTVGMPEAPYRPVVRKPVAVRSPVRPSLARPLDAGVQRAAA